MNFVITSFFPVEGKLSLIGSKTIPLKYSTDWIQAARFLGRGERFGTSLVRGGMGIRGADGA